LVGTGKSVRANSYDHSFRKQFFDFQCDYGGDSITEGQDIEKTIVCSNAKGVFGGSATFEGAQASIGPLDVHARGTKICMGDMYVEVFSLESRTSATGSEITCIAHCIQRHEDRRSSQGS
jgi:hypothetical protein